MNKENRLLFARSIFLLIVIVSFGLIIVTEKKEVIMLPKIKEKIENYLQNNYIDIKDSILQKDIEINNKTYQLKVISKENENYYFYIKYSNKKITDTYKKDYIEGKSILNYIEKDLENKIFHKTNSKCEIKINSTLNQFTESVKKRILSEDNLLELKIYTIKKELLLSNWTPEEIQKEINNLLEVMQKNNINPKDYTFIITDQQDITKSVEIQNITTDFINNKNQLEIIKDILNNNSSKLLTEYKITYKYLN